MGLACWPAANDRRMTLTIPTVGLEIRLVWAGRGGLWSAVAAADDQRGYKWPPVLARRRAMRVAVRCFGPSCTHGPTRFVAGWTPCLPSRSDSDTSKISRVRAWSWPATRRSGWPPREFHHRRRSRVPDTLLVTTTRWTIEELVRAVEDVDSIDSAILGADARSRMRTAAAMLNLEPLASSHPVVPSQADLVALRTSGRPWGAVAAVARCLRIIDHDPAQLALLPLDPDPALADRLFHVAVLGCILRASPTPDGELSRSAYQAAPTGSLVVLSDRHQRPRLGCLVRWPACGPLRRGFSLRCRRRRNHWDRRSAGCRHALVRRTDRAIIIECKYSANPTYVGRNGYEQALAYMSEARSGPSAAQEESWWEPGKS